MIWVDFLKRHLNENKSYAIIKRAYWLCALWYKKTLCPKLISDHVFYWEICSEYVSTNLGHHCLIVLAVVPWDWHLLLLWAKVRASLLAQRLRIHLQCRRPRFSPWLRKIPWRRKWNPLQYSCLENPTNRGGWRVTVHGIANSQTRLSN